MDADQFEQEVKRARKRATILARDLPPAQRTLVEEVFQELQTSLEELQVAQEELHQQNEELMSARSEIEAERQRYRDLFEFAPDGYLVTSFDGTILEANRAAANMFEIEQRFLIGKPFINYITEQERGDFRSWFNHHRQDLAGVPHEKEARLRPRSKKVFDVGFSMSPVQDQDGKPVAIRWLLRDITERKVIEEEVRALNRELEQRVRERTAQLEEANRKKDELLVSEQAARKEAEAANRSKDEFLATVSHEMRTPLNAILGWAHILRSRPDDQATRNQAIQIIERNSKAQAQIIDDILDISRIVSGNFRLDLRPLDLRLVIEAALDSVRHLADAKAIQIDLELDRHTGIVMGDPNRLQQAVWNLLTNAVKFTPAGGSIRVELRRADDYAEIIVSDTGRGITKDFMPYVFDRFRQADSGSARLYSGLGLGLAIVRHMVEMHGGEVQARSEGENKGATFVLRLPQLEMSRQSLGNTTGEDDARWFANADNLDLKGVWAVVIDDEADAREMVAIVLRQWEARVTVTGSCSEVIETISGGSNGDRPDVLIADIAMPDENGFDLIRKVRALPPERGGLIPAIALTAYASNEDRLKALAAGYQVHMGKPVSMIELGNLVAKLTKSDGGSRKNSRESSSPSGSEAV